MPRRFVSSLLAALLLVGCGDPMAPRRPLHSATPTPHRRKATVTVAEPRQMGFTNVRLARDAKGTGAGLSFPAGTPELVLSFTPVNVPKGTLLRSLWTAVDGDLHSTDSLQASGPDSFSLAGPAGGWQPGQYQVELSIGSERKEVVLFEVTPAEAGGRRSPPPRPVVVATHTATATPEPTQETPPVVASSASLRELAHGLAPANASERVKALNIYRWIAEHISYDVPAFLSGDYGDQSPETVLRTRKGVCGGYANLYQALAREAGLEVETVEGYGKSFEQGIGQTLDKPNHGWNAVKVDGQWHLLDSTWGAGSTRDGKFERKYSAYYFMTPPEEFIFSHFPAEERWQLLKSPIGRSEFDRKPVVSARYFQHKLELISHRQAVIDSDGELEVKLGAPPGVELSASVMADGRRLEESALVSRQGNRFTIQAVFPKAGHYQLMVFAAPRGEQVLHDAVTYQVQARGGKPRASFPHVFQGYLTHEVRLAGPLQGELSRGRTEFQLTAQGAQRMMVETTAGQQELNKVGMDFRGTVPLPGGEVKVYAMYGPGRWTGLLTYRTK